MKDPKKTGFQDSVVCFNNDGREGWLAEISPAQCTGRTLKLQIRYWAVFTELFNFSTAEE